MKLKVWLAISCLIYATGASAQQKQFSDWDATAFCSYTVYHPFHYIKADNNWELIRALQRPHARTYLDSLGIKHTDSQFMLLHIEGLLDRTDDGRWVSAIPVLDSLTTAAARAFSSEAAAALFPLIEGDCSSFVEYLNEKDWGENAFTLLFSYVLDGKIWKSFNTYDDLKSAATWSGACWAFYLPRDFRCGTNTFFNRFAVCWTRDQPELVKKALNVETFIEPFLDDYDRYGKIVSPAIHAQALASGLIDPDGRLRIPVIGRNDAADRLNILSDRIADTIVRYFAISGIVAGFQKELGLDPEKKKLARAILYHEVMWDLMDLLLRKQIVRYPAFWETKNEASLYSVVFIKNE